MNQTNASLERMEDLVSTIINITKIMTTKDSSHEIGALYNDGLENFLQLRELGYVFFSREKEVQQHNSPIFNQLSRYNAEKQFYLSQLNKSKRENKETDSYLYTVAQTSDFDLQYINTELSIRIRLEKELLELKKNLKTLTTAKDAEEKKLDDLKSNLKTFSEFSKPLNDYLLLGNTFLNRQPKPVTAEPERTALLSSQLPIPLYVLYKSFYQTILTYKKEQKLSVDIIETHPNNHYNALNISSLSVIFRIITHRKKDWERVIIILKFDYLRSLELVLSSAYSQRGENLEFNELLAQKETHFLNDLIKNDNGEKLPTSSKAFLYPELVPLACDLKGGSFNWVQALCGYSIPPCPSLSYAERVNYRPLEQISDYIPDKYIPKSDLFQQSPKLDSKIEVDDAPVEIIEMDVIDQGDLMMMQDTDYTNGRQEKEEEEAKEISDADDSEPKNDSIQEDETDMVIDNSKLNGLMHNRKRSSDLNGDSSIVLNFVRMIKDHWWRKNS